MAVADAELGTPLRIPMELLEAGRLDEHWCDKKHRHMAVIGEDGEHHLHPGRALYDPVAPVFIPLIVNHTNFSGKWKGETDEGRGSPHIRCRPFKQRLVDLLTLS